MEVVRTFGQQVGHVARYNFLWCAQSKGEKNPMAGTDLEKLPTKAELIKALTDAFAYCDEVYNSLTDASGSEMIDITQESGRQAKSLRMGLLILNYGHNNEIYGSMVSYLRMKNIVPPASEPRPAKDSRNSVAFSGARAARTARSAESRVLSTLRKSANGKRRHECRLSRPGGPRHVSPSLRYHPRPLIRRADRLAYMPLRMLGDVRQQSRPPWSAAVYVPTPRASVSLRRV